MSSNCLIAYPDAQSKKTASHPKLNPKNRGWSTAKKSELESKQSSEKMEAIRTIAGGVAHNFRNTLAEILINSQVIQLNFEDVPGLQAVAERINTSVKRAARLVDGLVQFSRHQAIEEFKPCDLTQLIHETCDLIRGSFDNRIDVTLDLPESLPIFGDHSTLRQAIMNICSNARDAMPDGGTLHIRCWKQAGKVMITIADTGLGMDHETTKRCFDPFFTTKPIGRGIGMGLSSTYAIIKSHAGMIKVNSAPGKGTTFEIQLPKLSEAGVRQHESRGDPMNDRRLLLINSDVSHAQRTAAQLLSLPRHRKERAGSSNKAVWKNANA